MKIKINGSEVEQLTKKVDELTLELYNELKGCIADMEAIKAANRGLSSKNLPDAENRGFGIRTSKQMLIHGLGGQYLMISGSSLYLKSCNLDISY